MQVPEDPSPSQGAGDRTWDPESATHATGRGAYWPASHPKPMPRAGRHPAVGGPNLPLWALQGGTGHRRPSDLPEKGDNGQAPGPRWPGLVPVARGDGYFLGAEL